MNFVFHLLVVFVKSLTIESLRMQSYDLIVIGSGPALGPVKGDEIAIVGAAVNVGTAAKPPIPANA